MTAGAPRKTGGLSSGRTASQTECRPAICETKKNHSGRIATASQKPQGAEGGWVIFPEAAAAGRFGRHIHQVRISPQDLKVACMISDQGDNTSVHREARLEAGGWRNSIPPKLPAKEGQRLAPGSPRLGFAHTANKEFFFFFFFLFSRLKSHSGKLALARAAPIRVDQIPKKITPGPSARVMWPI